MGICAVKGCETQSNAKGLCSLHYMRQKRGSTDLTRQKQIQYHGLSKQERFEKYFIKDSDASCWIWRASLNSKGYGQFNLTGKKVIPAHRAAWIIYKGEIPANPESAFNTLYVCHKCDNPLCVNPEHLFLGSQQGNMDDKMDKGRHVYGNCYGEQHARSKLTVELVREIRASSEGDLYWHRKLGIARASIHAARHRKTWQHVE